MRRLLLVVVFLLVGIFSVQAQPLAQVHDSHVQGHVPPEASFRELLERDLLQEVRKSLFTDAQRVETELLRKAATQSGVALPKFYVWLKIFSEEQTLLSEGATRVAALERSAFILTVFLSRAEIQADSSRVALSFPAALVPEILSRAEQ